MNTRGRFCILLGFAILAGAVAGFLAGRTGPDGRSGGPRASGQTGEAIPASGNGAGAESLARDHPDEQLAAWLDTAWDILQRKHGPGFLVETDAPELLLSLERLTSADFTRLMEALDRRPDGEARRLLQEMLRAEWSARDPRAALAWTHEHRPDIYKAAVISLSAVNPAAAWAEWKSQPGGTDDSGEPGKTIFRNWARLDREAALEALLTPGPRLDGGASTGFYDAAIPDRVKFPREWEEAREGIARRLLEMEDAPRVSEFSSLIRGLHDRGGPGIKDELAAWITRQPLPEASQALLLTSMAQWEGLMSPAASRENFSWLWERLPDSQRGETLTRIVEFWASPHAYSSQDTDGCGKWLNEQTNLSPGCAPALKAFALYAADKDPESGLAWARRVPDPALREEAVREVTSLILKHWPGQAAALGLTGSPGND